MFAIDVAIRRGGRSFRSWSMKTASIGRNSVKLRKGTPQSPALKKGSDPVVMFTEQKNGFRTRLVLNARRDRLYNNRTRPKGFWEEQRQNQQISPCNGS